MAPRRRVAIEKVIAAEGKLNPEEPPEVLTADPDNPLGAFSQIQRDIIFLKRRFPNASLAEISRLLGKSESAVAQHFRRKELEAVLKWLEGSYFVHIEQLRLSSLRMLQKVVDEGLAEGAEMDAKKLGFLAAKEVMQPSLQAPSNIPKPSPVLEVLFKDSTQPGLPESKP
jgi:AcrR family transcriptional regulator